MKFICEFNTEETTFGWLSVGQMFVLHFDKIPNHDHIWFAVKHSATQYVDLTSGMLHKLDRSTRVLKLNNEFAKLEEN